MDLGFSGSFAGCDNVGRTMMRSMEFPNTQRALERHPATDLAPSSEPLQGNDTDLAHWLYCRACGTRITSNDNRITMAGQHEHHCANPHGIHFHIGCFRTAPGCSAVGRSTHEFTWFAGYSWRIAVCGTCHAHLGWRYSGESGYFHGLILGQLRRAS
jgi:hypothetical protein